MAIIVDYASLTQAIQDFLHRADVTAGGFSDYFIQGAIEKITDDIFEENMGNGIRYMETAFAPMNMNGGTLPVPSDWVAPKLMEVSDGEMDLFTLIFKSPAWIYDQYPIRQPAGLPAYIARDVMAACSFTASLAAGILNVSAVGSGILQTGMVITGAGFPAGITNSVTITGQNSGTPGLVGFYTVSNTTLSVGSEAMTGGGNIFVFGTYPDSSYQVQGTYYNLAPMLSNSNTTNWMVLNAPTLLHSACMIKAGEFLKDQGMIAQWEGIYQPRLEALITKDKAERWAASTMQIEVG